MSKSPFRFESIFCTFAPGFVGGLLYDSIQYHRAKKEKAVWLVEKQQLMQRNLQLQQYIQNQGLSENNLTGFPLQVALLSQDIFQPEKR
jgi:hypothetical protein